MGDIGEIKPSIPEPALTNEQIAKSDRDIQTLISIRDYLTKQGKSYAIADGYAVEAHCSRTITRPHGDMDIYVFVETDFDPAPLREGIEKVIAGEKHTQWRVQQVGEDGHSIEFREENKSKIFESIRRLEVSFIGPDITPRIQIRTIKDSKGIKYELAVEHIADLAAAKIIKLVDRQKLSEEEWENKGLRPTRPSDFNEIKRLLQSPELSDKICLEAITLYLLRGDNNLKKEEAVIQAKEYLDQVQSLLQNFYY